MKTPNGGHKSDYKPINYIVFGTMMYRGHSKLEKRDNKRFSFELCKSENRAKLRWSV